MSPHDLHALRHSGDDEITDRRESAGDEHQEPETIPDTTEDAELLQAIEWLKKAGVVTDERPAFSSFFEELAGDGENTDTGSRAPVLRASEKKVG